MSKIEREYVAYRLKFLKDKFKENRKKINASSYPTEDNFNRRELVNELKAERKEIKNNLTTSKK